MKKIECTCTDECLGYLTQECKGIEEVNNLKTNKMKKTAVEWIISKLPMVNDNDPYLSGLIDQAKEMEKQQIKSAYGAGIETMRKCFSVSSHIPKGAEDFYNETYKK